MEVEHWRFKNQELWDYAYKWCTLETQDETVKPRPPVVVAMAPPWGHTPIGYQQINKSKNQKTGTIGNVLNIFWIPCYKYQTFLNIRMFEIQFSKVDFSKVQAFKSKTIRSQIFQNPDFQNPVPFSMFCVCVCVFCFGGSRRESPHGAWCCTDVALFQYFDITQISYCIFIYDFVLLYCGVTQHLPPTLYFGNFGRRLFRQLQRILQKWSLRESIMGLTRCDK